MKLRTRSNALGVLAGIVTIALAVWGRYKAWWWYDNLAHFAAGVSLGSLVADTDSTLIQDLAIVTCVATLWEGFEYVRRIYPWDGSIDDAIAAEDTALDTLLVWIGAYVGARSAKRST